MSKLTVVSKRRVFTHPWENIDIELVKTGTGTQEYLVSYPNDFVIIVPFIDDEHLVAVRQYKHGAKKVLFGFPAGFLRSGETPENCARRELEEELGYIADSFERIAELSENPTRCRNSYFIVFARHVTRSQEAKQSNPDELEGEVEEEIITRTELLTPKAVSRIQAGPMLSVLPFL